MSIHNIYTQLPTVGQHSTVMDPSVKCRGECDVHMSEWFRLAITGALIQLNACIAK